MHRIETWLSDIDIWVTYITVHVIVKLISIINFLISSWEYQINVMWQPASHQRPFFATSICMLSILFLVRSTMLIWIDALYSPEKFNWNQHWTDRYIFARFIFVATWLVGQVRSTRQLSMCQGTLLLQVSIAVARCKCSFWMWFKTLRFLQPNFT